MIQVRQKVKEIVEEIEYPEQMSGKQIGEIILGKGQKQENASIHSTYLEIKQLKEYVEKNNQSYNITIETAPTYYGADFGTGKYFSCISDLFDKSFVQ